MRDINSRLSLAKFWYYRIRLGPKAGVPMKEELLKLDNQLCHRLYAVSNAITRAYRPYLKELGLTYPQYVVMMALWEKDGIAIQELIAKTKIDGGSLTQVLGKMQKANFISVTGAKDDRRKKIIHLTADGQSLKAQAGDVPQKMACKFENVDPKEFQDLIQLLDKMSCELDRC